MKYIYNLKKDKKNIHELLLDMKDNNNINIVTGIKVEFTRKNKTFIKDLYIIMTNDMIQNIKEPENIQYFSDTTYYCIPPQCKSLKMWILLSYNKKYNKILICNISLIKNENLETYKKILLYLKDTFNFKPEIMTVDFCKAAYIAFKNIYKDIIMVPCFFHLIQRLILHLPQYKDSKLTIKNNAKNILINIKILCFVDNTKIDELFEKIKDKYYHINKNFFDYFIKTFLKNSPFNDRNWNYSNFYKKIDNKDLFFFTNNVAESMNRMFNSHVISNRKSFYSFRKCILETLDYFKNKEEYIEKGSQITRAIYLYIKEIYNQDRLPLLTHKDMSKIIENYNKKKKILLLKKI